MNVARSQQRTKAPTDPLLQQRLAELGSRRVGTPLPPPSPGAQRATASQPRGKAQQRNAKAGHRSQAPQRLTATANDAADGAGARIAALAAARGNGNGKAMVGRRAKPARGAKLVALALSGVTTIGLAGVFANQSIGSDLIQLTNATAANPLVATAPVTPGATPAAPAPVVPAPVVPAPVVPAPVVPAPVVPGSTVPAAAAPPSGMVDGTYLGTGDRNYFGTVQAQVVYAGGQIVDVQIVQYPNHDQMSLQISQIALPRLINESISAQTASVDTVSGATYTSNSYRLTLQSAIDAARSASGISG